MSRGAWPIALALVAAGVVVGTVVLRPKRPPEALPPPARLFEQVLSHVQRFGVDSLDEAELYELATRGLLGQLEDEYATLLPAGAEIGLTESADVAGLGMLLAARGGRISVLAVLPGSPADLAGLSGGDQLLEVDSVPIDPGRRDRVLTLLAGEEGTAVQVRVRRPGMGLISFALTRGEPRRFQVLPGLKLDDQVGYVAVRLLGPGAARAVEREVEALARSGVRALILDLRGASQGSLREATALADLFLEPGAGLVEVRGREPGPRRLGDDAPQDRRLADLAVVTLVDSSTADAAEVVAGALQDNDRALLVGQPTFGRGLTPESFPLADDLVVRISTGRWYTPAGRAIQRDSAAQDTVERRPKVRTARGREVYAGGGIVPDTLARRDSLPTAEQALLRAIGSAFPAWWDVVRGVAAAGAGAPIPVAGSPRPELLARLRAGLDSAGITVSDEVWTGAAGLVSRRLGDEMVRASWGADSLLHRRVSRDPLVERAVALLRAARSPLALVLEREE